MRFRPNTRRSSWPPRSETQEWAGTLYSQVSAALMSSLKKAGMTIIEADEAAFRKAVEPVYAKHAEKFAAQLQAIRDIK